MTIGDRVTYDDINLFIAGYKGVIIDIKGEFAVVQWHNGIKNIEWLPNLRNLPDEP